VAAGLFDVRDCEAMDPSVASSLIAAGAALLGAALGFAGSLFATRQAAKQAREQPQYERRSKAIHEMHRALLELHDTFRTWHAYMKGAGELAAEFPEKEDSILPVVKRLTREEDEKLGDGLRRMDALREENALLLRQETRAKLSDLLDKFARQRALLTSPELERGSQEYARLAYETDRWLFASFPSELEELRELLLRDAGVEDQGYALGPQARERDLRLRREAYDDMERRLGEIEQRMRSSENDAQTDTSKDSAD
jgi:hypothetical protein